VSEHEQMPKEEEGQEREELEDLDVPEEESDDVKGGAEPVSGRPAADRNIN
jgi:hypothetical protein